MCDRTKIVTNGCNASCCKKFSLPFSLKELEDSRDAALAGKTEWIDRRGKTRGILQPNEEINYIIDMLIFIEYGENSPEYNKPLIDVAIETEKEIVDGMFNNADLIDGRLFSYYYTCKHFDKEKEICGAYETRPTFCKSFGSTCAYQGCGFQNTLKALQNIVETDQTKGIAA